MKKSGGLGRIAAPCACAVLLSGCAAQMTSNSDANVQALFDQVALLSGLVFALIFGFILLGVCGYFWLRRLENRDSSIAPPPPRVWLNAGGHLPMQGDPNRPAGRGDRPPLDTDDPFDDAGPPDAYPPDGYPEEPYEYDGEHAYDGARPMRAHRDERSGYPRGAAPTRAAQDGREYPRDAAPSRAVQEERGYPRDVREAPRGERPYRPAEPHPARPGPYDYPRAEPEFREARPYREEYAQREDHSRRDEYPQHGEPQQRDEYPPRAERPRREARPAAPRGYDERYDRRDERHAPAHSHDLDELTPELLEQHGFLEDPHNEEGFAPFIRAYGEQRAGEDGRDSGHRLYSEESLSGGTYAGGSLSGGPLENAPPARPVPSAEPPRPREVGPMSGPAREEAHRREQEQARNEYIGSMGSTRSGRPMPVIEPNGQTI